MTGGKSNEQGVGSKATSLRMTSLMLSLRRSATRIDWQSQDHTPGALPEPQDRRLMLSSVEPRPSDLLDLVRT
jgi:hypothetical protein